MVKNLSPNLSFSKFEIPAKNIDGKTKQNCDIIIFSKTENKFKNQNFFLSK